MIATIKKQTRKWTTKGGTRIRICDMSDRHLLNAYDTFKDFVERRRATVAYMHAMLNDCGFFDDVEEEVGCNDSVDNLYNSLEVEIERRGLKPHVEEDRFEKDYSKSRRRAALKRYVKLHRRRPRKRRPKKNSR